jgi:hypothetical protein
MAADGTEETEGLDAERKRTLAVLLNLMIPPSGDGRLPGAGAAEVDLLGHLRRERLAAWARDGLAGLVQAAHGDFGGEFAALDGAAQQAAFDAWRRREPRFFAELSAYVLQCYYQNDRVLEAIGLEARPPFPLGYVVPEGDLTLLEPVMVRGKLYRD